MQSSFLSVLKTLLKPVTLQVSFVCKRTVIASSFSSDYHIYTLYITSLLFFPLVIVCPNPHQSEHESDLCSVPEAGIILSLQLMSKGLWFLWLNSPSCFKDMYVMVPETADGGFQDTGILCQTCVSAISRTPIFSRKIIWIFWGEKNQKPAIPNSPF